MEITSNVVQTVASRSNVTFTETRVSGNCSIIHSEGSGLVKLRGLSSTQCRARFRVHFGGNVAIPADGTVGPISLALTIDGEPVGPTTMIVTPAAVSEYFNVSSSVYLEVPTCCCSTVGVTNLTDEAIEVANPNLIVERVA